MPSERLFRRSLIVVALIGLALGFVAWAFGREDLSAWFWVSGTAPVVAGLLFSIIRSFRAGGVGVNAGHTFEIRATATAGESTYAGIVKLVNAAQTAKAPFIRLADRYALLLLPVTLLVAGGAWLLSGDPIRALAVLVAATPCPLILAAPVALIAGVSQAARRGILIKGGGPLEALAH